MNNLLIFLVAANCGLLFTIRFKFELYFVSSTRDRACIRSRPDETSTEYVDAALVCHGAPCERARQHAVPWPGAFSRLRKPAPGAPGGHTARRPRRRLHRGAVRRRPVAAARRPAGLCLPGAAAVLRLRQFPLRLSRAGRAPR